MTGRMMLFYCSFGKKKGRAVVDPALVFDD
jgi:hypothetical protein